MNNCLWLNPRFPREWRRFNSRESGNENGRESQAPGKRESGNENTSPKSLMQENPSDILSWFLHSFSSWSQGQQKSFFVVSRTMDWISQCWCHKCGERLCWSADRLCCLISTVVVSFGYTVCCHESVSHWQLLSAIVTCQCLLCCRKEVRSYHKQFCWCI